MKVCDFFAVFIFLCSIIIYTTLTGYVSYFSCSTAKKGYSGTAVFVKKDIRPSNDSTTVSIDYGIGKPEHEDEGRSIVVHFPKFSIGKRFDSVKFLVL